jgi:hypothetical protein
MTGQHVPDPHVWWTARSLAIVVVSRRTSPQPRPPTEPGRESAITGTRVPIEGTSITTRLASAFNWLMPRRIQSP